MLAIMGLGIDIACDISNGLVSCIILNLGDNGYHDLAIELSNETNTLTASPFLSS